MNEYLKNFKNLPALTSLRRMGQFAILNMKRNTFLSIATIIVIALILFSFNIILAVNNLSESVITELNKKVDIILYLQDGADLLEVENLVNELKNFSSVKEVKYTSQEEALKDFLKNTQETEESFQKYGLENTLPANIQIITDSPEGHRSIVSYIENSQYKNLMQNIERDEESQKIAGKLIHVTSITRKIMGLIMGTFIFGGIIIILNSISLNMYSRKEEIQIMKLVGAKHLFIKIPFIFEGALYGFFAVLISSLLLFIFTKSLSLNQMTFATAFSFSTFGSNIGKEMLVSIFVGIISSQIAIQRFFLEKMT
ncbi:hypothetical protein HYV57_03165 [Candidatus Peregrinibacteria bacterium]|nr:hypothetical protein [Candidatus Peregrinibacteria bacterium]